MTPQQLATENAVRAARLLIDARHARAANAGRSLTAEEQGDIDAALERVKRAQGAAEFDAALTQAIGSAGTGSGGRTLGAEFLNSDVWRWLKDSRNSRSSNAWTSPSAELHAATLTTDPASGGDLILPDERPGIVPSATAPTMVADLFAQGTTDSNVIAYLKETTFTNAAAPVLAGGAKPESTLIFDRVSDAVEKQAHWIPVTDELLEDAAGIRSYIDARLLRGLKLVEQDQLINGSGTSPAIRGILARVGLAASIARVAESNAEVLYAQKVAIEIATGLEVSAFVLHPSNWKAIELLRTAAGEYISGNTPFQAPHARTLWGCPVVVTSTIAAGTGLVGCFKTAAQIFRKRGVRIEVSNSHSDFFVKNLTAIRCEQRIALCCYVPGAFGLVTNLSA